MGGLVLGGLLALRTGSVASEQEARKAEEAAKAKERAAAREATLAPLRKKAPSDNARIKAVVERAQAAADAEEWERCLSALDEINVVTKPYSTIGAETLVDLKTIRRAQALAEQARTAIREAENASATIGVSKSELRKWTTGCRKKEIIRDAVKGRRRFMCKVEKGSTGDMVELIGDEGDLREVTILQGVTGNPMQMLNQLMNPIEMFQAIAGTKVGDFTPDGWLPEVMEKKTTVDYKGRRYTTNPLPSLGMISFSVGPAFDE